MTWYLCQVQVPCHTGHCAGLITQQNNFRSNFQNEMYMPMWQDKFEVTVIALGSPTFTHLCNNLSTWGFCL